jgi:RHS repeat-associated protein
MHLQTHTEKTVSTKKTVCRARAAGGTRPLSRTASGVWLHQRKTRVRLNCYADHQGSPRAVTRPSDNKVVWSWENTEAFGNSAPNQNPAALGTFVYNLRLPGQYWDQETGLSQNYFRDYDSSLGRYVQSDPIGLKGGINTYAYVKGNPLRWTDPLGLEICEPCSCKGGTWDQDFGDLNMNFGAGVFVGAGRQNLTCRTNKRLKCRTSQICVGGGPILGGGVGFNVSGTVYGAESCSALGNSWSDTQFSANFGPFGTQTPIGDPGGNVSVGPGFKGGAALITCYTIIWGCEQK